MRTIDRREATRVFDWRFCGSRIEHVRSAGLVVKEVIGDNMAPLTAKPGIPANLPSCDTHVIADDVIEAHEYG